jgi:hypothetical protein
MKAVEGAAKDQERPLLTDQLDHGGDRAFERYFLEAVDIGRARTYSHALLTPLSAAIKAQH